MGHLERPKLRRNQLKNNDLVGVCLPPPLRLAAFNSAGRLFRTLKQEASLRVVLPTPAPAPARNNSTSPNFSRHKPPSPRTHPPGRAYPGCEELPAGGQESLRAGRDHALPRFRILAGAPAAWLSSSGS